MANWWLIDMVAAEERKIAARKAAAHERAMEAKQKKAASSDSK